MLKNAARQRSHLGEGAKRLVVLAADFKIRRPRLFAIRLFVRSLARARNAADLAAHKRCAFGFFSHWNRLRHRA